MTYKTKVIVLSALVGALALAYTASLVFDPARAERRDAAYAWLDAGALPRVDAIEVKSIDGLTITLEKKDGSWRVPFEGQDYPAKAARIDDLLNFLSEKGDYPVRSVEAASMERLGLAEDGAERLTIKGGETILLDLLMGGSDSSGGVYLRKAGRDEARRGSSSLSSYISSPRSSWYDTSLFPEAEKPPLDTVQRVIIAPPADMSPDAPIDGANAALVTLARTEGGWTVNGAAADAPKAEAYIRGVLDTAADDFSHESAAASSLNAGNVRIELGNGTSRMISVGPKTDADKRIATVSDSPYMYSLALWAADRLFKTEQDFK